MIYHVKMIIKNDKKTGLHYIINLSVCNEAALIKHLIETRFDAKL